MKTTDALIKNHRRNYGNAELTGESRPQVAELIRDARTILDRAGINWSPSRVSRIVRAYLHQQGNGDAFDDYLATHVASEMQRRVVADELSRVTAYVDPTGERAVNHVLRGGRP